MKIFISLIVCLLASSQLAYAKPNLLEKGKVDVLAIYPSNLTQIIKSYDTALEKGGYQLTFNDIEDSILLDTFRLVQDNDLFLLDYSWLRQGSLNDQLGHYINQEIDVFDNLEKRSKTVKVVSTYPQIIFEDGDYLFTYDSNGRFTVPDYIAKVGYPNMVVKLNINKQVDDIVLSYLMRGGLSWQPSYQLILDREKNQLDLTAFATVRNDSHKNYQADSIFLLTADIDAPMAFSSHVMQDVMQAEVSTKTMARSDLPQSVSVDNYERYEIEGRVLPAGQSKTVVLAKESAIDYSMVYNVNSLFDLRDYNRNLAVTQVLEFKYDKPTGLPPGEVSIFSHDPNFIEAIVGFPEVGRYSDVDLVLRDERDINVTQTVIKTKQLSQEFVQQKDQVSQVNLRNNLVETKMLVTVEVQFENNKEEASNIVYRQNFSSGNLEFKESNIKPKVNTNNHLVFDFSLKPNEDEVLEYTFVYTYFNRL